MTSAELTEHRLSLGLTKGRAAFYFGADARSWRRWEAGQKAIPLSVVKLLSVCVKCQPAWEALQAIAEKEGPS